jgi:hypothetical protein
MTSLMNSSPAPEPTGNGTAFTCATTLSNSGNGAFRWKTMVRSSGVSIPGCSPVR